MRLLINFFVHNGKSSSHNFVDIYKKFSIEVFRKMKHKYIKYLYHFRVNDEFSHFWQFDKFDRARQGKYRLRKVSFHLFRKFIKSHLWQKFEKGLNFLKLYVEHFLYLHVYKCSYAFCNLSLTLKAVNFILSYA